MKNWTVAFVNYKTSVYMKWQLKALYEFNNPEDFDLIIVDNSRPKEKKELEMLTAPYQKHYNNISILKNFHQIENLLYLFELLMVIVNQKLSNQK